MSADSLKSMEILRRAAGGHGFSQYSGLPGLLSEIGPAPTFEGILLFILRLKFNFVVASCKIFNKDAREYTKK
jgi:hypothetical protein